MSECLPVLVVSLASGVVLHGHRAEGSYMARCHIVTLYILVLRFSLIKLNKNGSLIIPGNVLIPRSDICIVQ